MGEIHRLPDPARTEREAADWFARLKADDVTAEDRLRFDIWLHAHASHKRASAELKAGGREWKRAGRRAGGVGWGQAMKAAAAAGQPRHWLPKALAAALAVTA